MRQIILNKLYQTIGYSFKNPVILEQAMTHRSFESRANNERLEFLGDAILDFVITEELFKRFSTCTEGELTRIRASLVKGATLAQMALEMGLGEVMHFGLGELNTGGFRRRSTLEDAFEAMIGAIYLDSDLPTIQSLLLKWFEPLLITVNIADIPRDYKSQLQEALQARGISVPNYQIIREEGPDHSKIFFVRCLLASVNQSTEGQGPNKKSAEQEAAKKALDLLITIPKQQNKMK